MGIVEEFTEFKAQLKEKWLDYCEQNQNFLEILYEDSICLNRDFILGVITVIEPKAMIWINFYITHFESQYEVTNSIDFLELNFDYKKVLEERKKNKLTNPPSPLDDFRNKNV